jgi:hypothetical protein
MIKFAVWGGLLLLIAAAANPATEQKGEAQPRTLSGHVFNGQDEPVIKAIV